jgi:hypothetical protein
MYEGWHSYGYVVGGASVSVGITVSAVSHRNDIPLLIAYILSEIHAVEYMCLIII